MIEGATWFLRSYSQISRPEPLLFFPSSSSIVLTGLSGPRIWGYIYIYIYVYSQLHRKQCNLISLFLFFINKEILLKIRTDEERNVCSIF
jgi:hypothetical protein